MNNAALPPLRRVPVWTFVVAAIALLVLVIVGLARTQGWFDNTVALHFLADSAADLRSGMQVRLFGISVGKVKKIALRQDGRVVVDMAINDDYLKFLHSDTQATLGREGLFGDSYIVLTSDRHATGTVNDQLPIPFDGGTSLGDLVTQLSERLFPLLDQLTQFAQQLNAPDGHLQSSLLALNHLLTELRQTRQQLDKALKQTEIVMAQRLPATLDKGDKMLTDFSRLATNLDHRLATISQQLDSTLKQFEQTGQGSTHAAEELKQLLQELRPALNQTLHDADVMINNANQTMNNMQTHWPFTPEQ